MYFIGQGVSQNYVEGYAWLIIAAENGEKQANEAKAEYQQVMTVSQITAAQQRAKEIQAGLKRK